MPLKQTARLFGESFNRGFEFAKRLRQRQEEFSRDLNFRNRQLGLNVQLGQDRIQSFRERTDFFEEKAKADLFAQGFPEIQGRENRVTGEFETTTTEGDIVPAEVNFEAFGTKFGERPPETQKPTTVTELRPLSEFGEGFDPNRLVEVKYSVDAEGNRTIVDIGTSLQPAKEDKPKEFNEGQLSIAARNALGFLTEPNVDDPNVFQSIFGTGEFDTPESIREKIADKVAIFALDFMGSATYEKMQTIFVREGFVTPKELRQRMKDRGLSEQEARELTIFLRFYKNMHRGLLKLEEAAK